MDTIEIEKIDPEAFYLIKIDITKMNTNELEIIAKQITKTFKDNGAQCIVIPVINGECAIDIKQK